MRSMPGGIRVLMMGFLLVLPLVCMGQTETTLVVTGSSMPEPLYKAWAEEYHKQHPDVQVRYLAVGTSESAQDVLKGSGDFGGGEAPFPESELNAGQNRILQLPAVLVGIVVVYNLPQAPGELKLTGRVLADIYLGRIKEWRDPAIVKLNPGMNLPALPIQLIHRTGGKGSNYILSGYLSKVSPDFLAVAGHSDSPKWPVGEAIPRAQDLHEKVAGTPGAIGYTELNLAANASLRVALIQNAAGEFVKPTKASIADAVAGSNQKGANSKGSLRNAPGKGSYPISSYTWMYVPSVAKDPQRGRAVAEFLAWIYGDGQKVAEELGYATLPHPVLAEAASKAAAVH